jgi:hypothetical protein
MFGITRQRVLAFIADYDRIPVNFDGGNVLA